MSSAERTLSGRWLTVDIGHHKVDTADDRDEIGYERAAADERDHLQMRK